MTSLLAFTRLNYADKGLFAVVSDALLGRPLTPHWERLARHNAVLRQAANVREGGGLGEGMVEASNTLRNLLGGGREGKRGQGGGLKVGGGG